MADKKLLQKHFFKTYVKIHATDNVQAQSAEKISFENVDVRRQKTTTDNCLSYKSEKSISPFFRLSVNLLLGSVQKSSRISDVVIFLFCKMYLKLIIFQRKSAIMVVLTLHNDAMVHHYVMFVCACDSTYVITFRKGNGSWLSQISFFFRMFKTLAIQQRSLSFLRI